MNVQKALRAYEDALGRVPEGIEIPLLPLNFATFLAMIPDNIKWERQIKEHQKKLPAFVAASPGRCGEFRQRIQETRTNAGLVSLWREELRPYFLECCWMLRAGMKLFADPAAKLRRDLTKLVGTADAFALLSKFSIGSEQLGQPRSGRGFGKSGARPDAPRGIPGTLRPSRPARVRAIQAAAGGRPNLA